MKYEAGVLFREVRFRCFCQLGKCMIGSSIIPYSHLRVFTAARRWFAFRSPNCHFLVLVPIPDFVRTVDLGLMCVNREMVRGSRCEFIKTKF